VTLVLLWQEYRARDPQGYGYSRFCDHYGEWRRKISATMRQTHVAGEKLFVDFAGDTVPVFDAATGQTRLDIFVAALGASNYTYAEARWSEGLADWIGSHVNALTTLGGVPKAVVCDNLKAGVTRPSRYEPGINRMYQELAEHYGFVVLPTRLRKPRDKARITDGTVEILHKGSRVASHARSLLKNSHTTIKEHIPSAHRPYAEWTPARLMQEAARIGPSTIALIEAIMKAKPHPEQGFRSCLGILRLAKIYGAQRLEAACRRGDDIGARSYGSTASILKHGLDRTHAQDTAPRSVPIRHANIRGRGYYH
jgi:transposase